MENEQKKISNIEHTADSLEDLYNDEINTTTIKRNIENKNKITNIDKNKDIKNNEIIDLSDNEEDENILGKKRKKNEEKSFEIIFFNSINKYFVVKIFIKIYNKIIMYIYSK